MNRKNYEIASLPAEIIIGRQTETGVMDIRIDCTGWLTFWPKLSLSIWVTPPGGSAAYPATTHREGNVLVWDVNNSDTAVAGSGTMEVVGIASGQKKLSAVTKTRVERTTTSSTTTPPAGAKAWMDDVLQAAGEAEAAKNQAANYAQQAAKSAEEAKQNAGGGVADSVAWSDVTGKPSTYPPATHTHTEYLAKTGTAANSAKLGGKAPEYYLQPVNLLGNSDLRNPVNQREQTSYTSAGYYLDRWVNVYARPYVTVNDGYVSFANDSSTAYRTYQRLHAGTLIAGKTYTAAIKKHNGNVYCAQIIPEDGKEIYGPVMDGSVRICLVKNSDFDAFSLSVAAQTTLDLEWAALYEGAYTEESLPPYVPKGYAVELAECRRYFRRKINALVPGFVSNSSKGITISIENDAPFVGVPTLAVTSIAWIRGAGKNITTIPTWTTSVYSNNAISPVFNIDFAEAIDQTAYASVYVYCSYTLSADL